MRGPIRIEDSIALAATALRPLPGKPSPPDSLRLQLPPIGIGNGGPLPDAAILRVMAALYLYAEHEQAGLIPVAEVLVASRDSLGIQDVGTAGKMETFYQRSRQWYDRNQRKMLFGRLFGLGPGSDEGGNHDFQRIFAAFCLAITASSAASRFGRPGAFEDAHVAETALELLGNLGAHQYGSALVAARALHDQLAAAVDLLLDKSLQITFQARGLWDLLQKIMGDQAPDFGRLSHRGQNGQHILEWLATAIPQLSVSPPRVPLIGPQSPVAVWAAGWLDATGVLPANYAQGLAI